MSEVDGAARGAADGVYVGLMSGTSLDGISAAVVRFTSAGTGIEHELLAFNGSAYTAEQRDRLASAMNRGTAEDYCALSFDLGEWLAAAALSVIRSAHIRAHIDTREIRAIASHGQTIWHSPRRATWE
jgi:anhydro-N-acetylmuramic acid kinase